MPLYEYECFLCGHRFERIQRVSDDPASECPACGGAVRRLLGVPALQFKGSGWYVTDYGAGKGSKGAEKKEPAKDTSAAGADTSSSTGNASKSTSSGEANGT